MKNVITTDKIKNLTPIAFVNLGRGIYVYVYHIDAENGTVVYVRPDGQAVTGKISSPKTSEAFFPVKVYPEDEAPLWPVHIYDLAWCQDPRVYEENEKYFGAGQE